MQRMRSALPEAVPEPRAASTKVAVCRTPLQAACLRLQLAKLAHARLGGADFDALDVDLLALVGARIVSDTTVVFAHGSDCCVVGFGYESSPRSSIASVVGVPRHQSAKKAFPTDGATPGYLVGHMALSRRGICRLSHPIERGLVASWDRMEQIWRHAFYAELATSPADCCALLTEPAINPKANRERTVQMFFEVFKVRALFLTTKEALTLHALGRTTGIVLNIGVSVLAVPIYEGHILAYAITNPYEMPNAHDVTDYMMRLLSERGYEFVTTAHREVAREIKERLCYVAADFEAELAKSATEVHREYDVPEYEGQVFTIEHERFRCPEVLFRSSLLGRAGFEGIHHYTWSTITKCDLSVRRQMFESVVLAGGCALFPGIAERFRNDLQALVQGMADPDIYSKAQVDVAPKSSAWLGGSMLVCDRDFQPSWITDEEYYEYGPAIVHRKCF